MNEPLTVAIAERALGLAARELNDLVNARRHLRRSIVVAERADLREDAAITKGRLAYVISLGGDTELALSGLEQAITDVTGIARAQLQAQRALVLQRTGRVEEALDQYRLSIPLLRRSHEYLDEARARSNRAVLQSYRGNYIAAEADLNRAAELAPLAGEGISPAKIHHNLGFIAACRGNVPEALAWFDKAQAELAQLGQSEAPVLSDRCEVLLAVGLAQEGLDAALLAVAELEQRGSALDLAEARLMVARAALSAGELATVKRSARMARAEFRRQARAGWEALAEYVIARADIDASRRSVAVEPSAIAEKLVEAGWHLPAVELRLAWAMAALTRDQSAAALRQLEIVSSNRRKRPALMRGHGWHAEALIRQARGDIRGCRTALRAGLLAFDEYQTALGATDLQAHAAGRASDLAALGCRIALDEKSAIGVFEWSERWRAGAFRNRSMRPRRGREIEQLLADLRHVTRTLESAAFEGRSTTSYLQQQARLEAAIRDRSRHSRGSRASRMSAPPSLRDLRRDLDRDVLVEYIAIGGRIHAVTVTPRRTKLFNLGLLSDVVKELDSLRFSFARLARGSGTARSIETFAAAAEHAAQSIDECLFGPLEAELEDAPLVIVPTGRLHHLPWSGLPTCASRVVSVAPSAAMWHAARRHRQSTSVDRVVLVAGPGVPHAAEEIRELNAIYPEAVVLVGAEATTVRVSEALDGARLAHIAAHGIFRSDNPMFSSLQLFDGRLTVYDLEQIRKPPELLVLSACESGLNAVHLGDELLGLSSAVLSLGTVNLVASVVPISDVVTASFMVKVHSHLAKRESPPKALALARQDVDTVLYKELVTTSSFVCFGA